MKNSVRAVFIVDVEHRGMEVAVTSQVSFVLTRSHCTPSFTFLSFSFLLSLTPFHLCPTHTVGDHVYLRFINKLPNSTMEHAVDFHGATGQGGGAGTAFISGTHTLHGEESLLYFKAIIPGSFIYHCVSNYINAHIGLGMYGLITVEPAEGLPYVDHEMYVVQGDIYTQWPIGSKSSDGVSGHQRFSPAKEHTESADYYVFNGAAGAFNLGNGGIPIGPYYAGDTVRMFVGSGGPNGISSFHVIGEMFDRVWREADVSTDPALNVQTTLVMPGGAAVVDFYIDVPGIYVLVDHALTRTFSKGLAAMMVVLDPATKQTLSLPEDMLTGSTRVQALTTYNSSYHDIYFGICDRLTSSPVLQDELAAGGCNHNTLFPHIKEYLMNNSMWDGLEDNRNSGRMGQRSSTPDLCPWSGAFGQAAFPSESDLCAHPDKSYS